jgi:hypothetical protein
MLQSLVLALPLLAGVSCAPGYVYTDAEVVYGEPPARVYVVPVDRVVVVTREVLVNRGWSIWRVERRGPDRIVWARRGDDVVRIFASPRGDRVAVRGLMETRDRDDNGRDDHGHHDNGRHRGYSRRGPPDDVIGDIDVRLRDR